MIYAGVGDAVDGGDGPVGDNPATEAVETDFDLGVDTVSYANQEDTSADMDGRQGVTIALDTTGANTVSNAEVVMGSPGSDTIVGGSARDMIHGGDGDDTLSGGGGGTGTGEDFSKATADVLVGEGGNDALVGQDDSVEVFAITPGGGDDTITVFALGEDHLHFVKFDSGVSPDCSRDGGSTTGITCTIAGQTVKIEVSDDTAFSDPPDLEGDLSIVVDPNA
jgi:Ca2+-binding RTX toxin-like protein